MGGLDDERRAILRWFDTEARVHPRSDYAAWCVYFRNQLATGGYKDREYWNATGCVSPVGPKAVVVTSKPACNSDD